MTLLKRWRTRVQAAVLVLAAVVAPEAALCQATFGIISQDGPNEGFNDPSRPDPASTVGGNSGATLGAQRRIAFRYAVDIWASRLTSDVVIAVEASFDPLACNATQADLGLAAANTVHRDFTRAPISITWYPAALANAHAGFDLAPGSSDISAQFNSALDGITCAFPRAWYYGLDGNPPADTIDFVSIALHELAHGLGFQTYMDADGGKLGGFDDAFLLWLEDHSTGDLLSDMATDAARASAITNTGNLHWVGPNVIAAGVGLTAGRHPGGHVRMYAPDPVEPASSASHFSTALEPDELMEPYYIAANHDVGLTLELMRDIGWSIDGSVQGNRFDSSSGGGGGGCFVSTVIGF